MMCIPRNILAKWQSGLYDRFYHHICISVSFYLNWGQIEFFAYITYINNKKVFMTYLQEGKKWAGQKSVGQAGPIKTQMLRIFIFSYSLADVALPFICKY